MTALGDLLALQRRQVAIDPSSQYKLLTIAIKGNGVRLRKEVSGAEVGTAKFKAIAGDLMISKIDARKGACGLLPKDLDGSVVTGDFLTYEVNQLKVLPDYLDLWARRPEFADLCDTVSSGTTNRVRMNVGRFPALRIPLPPLHEQRRIVDLIGALDDTITAAEAGVAAIRISQDRLRELLPAAHSVPIGRLLTAIDSGTSTKPVLGEGQRVSLLTLAAIRPASFFPGEIKDVGAAHLPDKALLREGDLLITRSNTPEKVGFVAVARNVPPHTYLPDLVWRLVPDESVVSKDYLEQVLSAPTMRAVITAVATGTSQSMQKINKSNFSTIKIPLPELSEQQAYVDPLRSLNAVASSQAVQTANLRTLRSNLLAALLSGEHEIPESYDELIEEAS